MASGWGNRPSLHLRDVKFDICNGKNILCLSPTVDLQRTYTTTYSRSDYIKTFMGVSQWLRLLSLPTYLTIVKRFWVHICIFNITLSFSWSQVGIKNYVIYKKMALSNYFHIFLILILTLKKWSIDGILGNRYQDIWIVCTVGSKQSWRPRKTLQQ